MATGKMRMCGCADLRSGKMRMLLRIKSEIYPHTCVCRIRTSTCNYQSPVTLLSLSIAVILNDSFICHTLLFIKSELYNFLLCALF